MQPKAQDFLAKVNAPRQKQHEPATLESAKKLTEGDLDILMDEKK